MISMFRSEEMRLCQIFLQSESAYACVSELGKLGLAEFRDLNPDVNVFQRKFVNEVRRCDEMERKLRFLWNEIDKTDIYVDDGENPQPPHPREMIDLEAQLEQLENEMQDSNVNYLRLRRSFLELTELKHILNSSETLFAQEGVHTETGIATLVDGNLGYVVGIITRDKISSFERLTWRACRGNVYFKYTDIDELLEDPDTGEMMYKCIFHIFFQGEQLKMKVQKICEGFRATLYPCPATVAERREVRTGVLTRLEDLNAVINETDEHRRRLLMNVAENVSNWTIKVKKIKAIYHTMNMLNFDVTQKCLIAECWVAVKDIQSVKYALRMGTENSGASVPSILHQVTTQDTPPTYNMTNKFTTGFQAIINAYGVADYQELNPALYTVITFPFLFSVMFGDFGHGIIMALFALMLILKEKRLGKWKGGGQMFGTIFQGRYIIFLMGVFSIYSGLIYNDVFSKSFNIFGSGWVAMKKTDTTYWKNSISLIGELKNTSSSAPVMFDPKHAARRTPYYFGLDPIWQLAINKLTFTNSLKMKLSIIFGVSHMVFGVVLSLFNHLHFKDRLSIWFEFVPQLLFISAIFGYLVILIFYKWIAYSCRDKSQPSLLLALIGMFLKLGKDIPPEEQIFPGQKELQLILVTIAVLSVPVMMLVKPLVLLYRNKAKNQFAFTKMQNFVEHESIAGSTYPSGSGSVQSQSSRNNDLIAVYNSDGGVVENAVLHKNHEEFEFGEVFIHSCIHTIEYCLGCISNTASYLRLWALSLAHAQLSEVLWSMVFHIGYAMKGNAAVVGIVLSVIFAAWAVLTIAILLIMEGLSAFLHTLRLHWVEFNSKFYKGQGHMFQPFSFKLIALDDEF